MAAGESIVGDNDSEGEGFGLTGLELKFGGRDMNPAAGSPAIEVGIGFEISIFELEWGAGVIRDDKVFDGSVDNPILDL